MSWQQALEAMLATAQPPFASDPPRCTIIGSVATALQGCTVCPRDVDILAADSGAVVEAAEWMSAHTPEGTIHPPGHAGWLSSAEIPVSLGPDDYGFLWHFGQWLVAGLKAEIAHITAPEGFPTSRDGAGIWEAGPEIWPHLRRMPFAGHEVPVVPLEIQLETSMSRGLEELVAAIMAVLRNQGYERELLERALHREHRQAIGALGARRQ